MRKGSPRTEERYPEACALVAAGKAPPQVARAVVLHRRGYYLREIAEDLGLALSTSHEVLFDPLREKARARKHEYDGVCVDCGGRTRGDGSRAGPPERCAECARRHWHEEARRRYLAALDDWAIRYGSPPTAWCWNLGLAKGRAHPETWQFLEAAHRERDWPTVSGVLHVFGSWNKFIRAGGYEPLPPGYRRDPQTWHRHQLERYAA